MPDAHFVIQVAISLLIIAAIAGAMGAICLVVWVLLTEKEEDGEAYEHPLAGRADMVDYEAINRGRPVDEEVPKLARDLLPTRH